MPLETINTKKQKLYELYTFFIDSYESHVFAFKHDRDQWAAKSLVLSPFLRPLLQRLLKAETPGVHIRDSPGRSREERGTVAHRRLGQPGVEAGVKQVLLHLPPIVLVGRHREGRLRAPK